MSTTLPLPSANRSVLLISDDNKVRLLRLQTFYASLTCDLRFLCTRMIGALLYRLSPQHFFSPKLLELQFITS